MAPIRFEEAHWHIVITTLLVLNYNILALQTPLYAALAPASDLESGSYLSDLKAVTHGAESEINASGEVIWVQTRSNLDLPPWPKKQHTDAQADDALAKLANAFA